MSAAAQPDVFDVCRCTHEYGAHDGRGPCAQCKCRRFVKVGTLGIFAKDGVRVAALVTAIESIAAGKPSALGKLAAHVFGWPEARVFDAIDRAVGEGLITRDVHGRVKAARR